VSVTAAHGRGRDSWEFRCASQDQFFLPGTSGLGRRFAEFGTTQADRPFPLSDVWKLRGRRSAPWVCGLIWPPAKLYGTDGRRKPSKPVLICWPFAALSKPIMLSRSRARSARSAVIRR
jgi:hypothetical protein